MHTQAFLYGDAVSARAAVNAIALPDADGAPAPNIIFLIAFDRDLETIVDEAAQLGMLDGYAWVCPDAPVPGPAIDIAKDPELLKSRIRGFRSLEISPILLDGFERASSVWKSMSPADCSNDLFEPPPASVFAQDPPHVFAYLYDATAAMAMALLEPYRDPPPLVDTNASEGTRTLHALRGLEFDGASGSVRFFDNGDRDNDGLELVIFEWLNVSNTIERVPVARLGLASNFSDIIHIPTDVALAGQWPGGRTEPPIDRRAAFFSQIPLALFLLLTSHGERLGASILAGMCGAVIAAKHVNARDGRIVSALAKLPANAPLINPLIYDTQSSEQGGLDAYRSAHLAGAAAIIGPSYSSIAAIISVLGNVDEKPIVSFWSSSPALSDDSRYQTFSRTFPSDESPTPAAAEWLLGQGWTHISILYVGDSYGAGYRNALALAAHQRDSPSCTRKRFSMETRSPRAQP